MNGKKRFVHVYTGDGKGKTTAALGLAVRAAGAGWKVLFAQFMKRGEFSEIKALGRFEDLVTVRQFGSGRFLRGKPMDDDIAAAMTGLAQVEEAMMSHEYDLIVLDEINVAVKAGLIPLRRLLSFLDSRPPDVELVLTGRGADGEVRERADLVTEMRMIKHYYNKGIRARAGIEK